MRPLYQQLVNASRLLDRANQGVTVQSDEGTLFVCINLENYDLVADAGDVLVFGSKELSPKVDEERLEGDVTRWVSRLVAKRLANMGDPLGEMLRDIRALEGCPHIEDDEMCDSCEEQEDCDLFRDMEEADAWAEESDTTEDQESG